MAYRRPYDEEFKQRAVRLVTEMGMSAPEVAKDLGCSGQAVRDWVKQAEIDAGQREGVTTDERERLRELEPENRRLREEREILKTSGRLLRPGDQRHPVQVYRFMQAQQAAIAVTRMCEVLEVSRSGYYAWRARQPCPRQRDDERLTTLIRRIHADARGCYGSPRVHADLVDGHDERVGVQPGRADGGPRRHPGRVGAQARATTLWRTGRSFTLTGAATTPRRSSPPS